MKLRTFANIINFVMVQWENPIEVLNFFLIHKIIFTFKKDIKYNHGIILIYNYIFKWDDIFKLQHDATRKSDHIAVYHKKKNRTCIALERAITLQSSITKLNGMTLTTTKQRSDLSSSLDQQVIFVRPEQSHSSWCCETSNYFS